MNKQSYILEDTNENKVLLENTKSQRQFKNAHGLSWLLSLNQQSFFLM
ncbi:hypothetical protein [Enterococcus alishanensis]|uniref:Uncharacterized protein n=1 Tax=Enterococcus alishanensis TaxID=1303817 RepID=A0ABS6TGD9_9ENTE|nr:hypothetical protein [Enterococcus alishanensis]MBV7392011.1 hypothetical protein [Enterococcus alishanensis]